MLRGVDLSKAHEVESVRRSIAMLGPGSPALNREDALLLLSELQRRPPSGAGPG